MAATRREFIRHSLVVLGAAATGGSQARGDNSSSSCGGSCAGRALAAVAVTGAAISDGEKSNSARVGTPGRKWVMVIDLAKCDGCGACTVACSKMHFIPPDRQWIKVLRMQESPHTAPYFFPQPCYHCDNPPARRSARSMQHSSGRMASC
jgi:molybdopterin-containing oxidoreductase family iron-sulfur binding subunit